MRRYLRFSLKTFLFAVVVFAIWLGIHLGRTKTQESATRSIREYGGWVRYDFQFPSGRYSLKDFDPKAKSHVPTWILKTCGLDFFHAVVQVNLNYSDDSGVREENHNPSDEALEYVANLRKLRNLLLSKTQATDESIGHLKRLNRLERLYMWDASKVSDVGVAHLKGLKRLRTIHIGNSEITDESMKTFATLPHLEELYLQGNKFSNDALFFLRDSKSLVSLVVGMGENTISDEGLVHLNGMKNLETLGLQHSQITDAGIRHLDDLPNLKNLWVSGTDVTIVGVIKAEGMHPGIIVTGGSQPSGAPQARKDLSALIREYRECGLETFPRYKNVSDDELEALHRKKRELANRFLTLGMTCGWADANVAEKALHYALFNRHAGEAGDKAANEICKYGFRPRNVEEIKSLCVRIGVSYPRPSFASERVLRQALDLKGVEGQAQVSLACLLREKAEKAKQQASCDRLRKRMEVEFGKDYVTDLQSIDADEALSEAESCCLQALARFPNEEFTQDQSIGDIAERELVHLQNLAIGKTAPEIVAKTVGGNTLRLSSLNGTIRVLLFCGRGCSPMYPEFRKLVTRLKGEPFELLCISRDMAAEQLEELIQNGEMNIRCWLDGENGPIHKEWGIDDSPRVFVLDEHGIIRFKDCYYESLNCVVDCLLEAMRRTKSS